MQNPGGELPPAASQRSVSNESEPARINTKEAVGGRDEGRAVSTLLASMLLACAGGSLDAFLYLDHNRVFAGAMTGNAVLAGLALLSHDHRDAVHHLLPIAAFCIGVWCAKLLDERLQRHAVSAGLGLEIGGLVLASFAPKNFPDLIFVPAIALLAAYQITTFKQVDEFSYNSTFITGNLRTAIEGLYEARHPNKRREGLRQFRELGLVIAAFISGASMSGLLAPHAGNHTLWLPAGVLLFVLAHVRRETSLLSRL